MTSFISSLWYYYVPLSVRKKLIAAKNLILISALCIFWFLFGWLIAKWPNNQWPRGE